MEFLTLKFIGERNQTVYFRGPTFLRGSNQPVRSNAIAFLSSSRADINTFEFLKTVEGIPLLI